MGDAEDIVGFKDSLSNTLNEFSAFAQAIQERCEKLHKHNEENKDLDLNNIEYIALSIVKMLRKTKGNILALLTFLETDLEQLNESRHDVLFPDVLNQIQETKTCTISIGNNNKVMFAPLVHKEVMVNLDAETSESIQLPNTQIPNTPDEVDVNFVSETVPTFRTFNLSLKRVEKDTDTEDTTDLWEDTLGRSDESKKGVKKENIPNSSKNYFEIEMLGSKVESASASKDVRGDTKINLDTSLEVPHPKGIMNVASIAASDNNCDSSLSDDEGSDSISDAVIDSERGEVENNGSTSNSYAPKLDDNLIGAESNNLLEQKAVTFESNQTIVDNIISDKDSINDAVERDEDEEDNDTRELRDSKNYTDGDHLLNDDQSQVEKQICEDEHNIDIEKKTCNGNSKEAADESRSNDNEDAWSVETMKIYDDQREKSTGSDHFNVTQLNGENAHTDAAPPDIDITNTGVETFMGNCERLTCLQRESENTSKIEFVEDEKIQPEKSPSFLETIVDNNCDSTLPTSKVDGILSSDNRRTEINEDIELDYSDNDNQKSEYLLTPTKTDGHSRENQDEPEGTKNADTEKFCTKDVYSHDTEVSEELTKDLLGDNPEVSDPEYLLEDSTSRQTKYCEATTIELAHERHISSESKNFDGDESDIDQLNVDEKVNDDSSKETNDDCKTDDIDTDNCYDISSTEDHVSDDPTPDLEIPEEHLVCYEATDLNSHKSNILREKVDEAENNTSSNQISEIICLDSTCEEGGTDDVTPDLEVSSSTLPELEPDQRQSDDMCDGSRLVDVVMEEFLSSEVTCRKLNEESCTEDIDAVKNHPPIVPSDEKNNGDGEFDNSKLKVEEPDSTDEQEFADDKLGEELLQLFKKVESESHLVAGQKSNEVVQKGSCTSDEDADMIFQKLQEDVFDVSDSDNDSVVDSHSGDVSLVDDSDIEFLCIEKALQSDYLEEDPQRMLLKQEMLTALKLKEKRMDRCYVRLERFDTTKHLKKMKNVTDSVDRLCDLSTLNKNAELNTSFGAPRRSKRKRKRKVSTSLFSTDCDDAMDDGSDSDLEITEMRGSSPELDPEAETRLDSMLARVAFKDLQGRQSNSDESDLEDDRKNKMEERRERDKDCTSREISASDRKYVKKAWRCDKLLTETFNSDSGASKKKGEHRTKENALEKSQRFEIVYGESSDEEVNKKAAKNKRASSSSSDSTSTSSSSLSSSDSDVEFVPKKSPPPPRLTPGSPQKGHRRNIRALMSNADLTEATLKANKEERERIDRLEEKQRLRISMTQSQLSITQGSTSSIENVPEEGLPVVQDDGLVLDVDAVTERPLVQVHPKLTKKLKDHQKKGIEFMWDSCYESIARVKEKDAGSGCILAHCMGLGKTFQVLTLIHTLFNHDETGTTHVLVVCPLSTVSNWRKEAKFAFRDLDDKDQIKIFTIGTKQELSNLGNIIRRYQNLPKAVLILGYDRYECCTNEEKISKFSKPRMNLMLTALVDPGPDLIVCDEGHLLKSNKSLKVQALSKVRTRRRIVLTGTPLQNNLIEYYHMVQFVKPNLLGNLKEFKTNFVNPITNGQYEDSTKEDIKLMKKRTHVLHEVLKKTVQRVEDTELSKYLNKMVHLAIFIQLHPIQAKLYAKFLNKCSLKPDTETVGTVRTQRKFLSDYLMLQYVSSHPHLLKIMDALRDIKGEREQDIISCEEDKVSCFNADKWWEKDMPPDAADNIQYGTKLVVMMNILDECEEIGDKMLVFSQSLGELDLIEHFLKTHGTSKCTSWKKDKDYARMDGTVKPELRSEICDRFNDKENKRLRLLLMSTKVGGLGLNLTAANRVITMSVSWNPSHDIQSVFRVYRFGQEKSVYVYRLVAMDTMEEKAYQRTVTKLAVAHRVIDKHQIRRHYKSVDLHAMYSCMPTPEKERPTPNVPDDDILAKIILRLPCIYKFHEHQKLLANRPEDDDLNEQEKLAAWEEFEKEKTIKRTAATASNEILHNLGPSFTTAYSLCPPVECLLANEKQNNNANNNSIYGASLSRQNNKNMQIAVNRPPIDLTVDNSAVSFNGVAAPVTDLMMNGQPSGNNLECTSPQDSRSKQKEVVSSDSLQVAPKDPKEKTRLKLQVNGAGKMSTKHILKRNPMFYDLHVMKRAAQNDHCYSSSGNILKRKSDHSGGNGTDNVLKKMRKAICSTSGASSTNPAVVSVLSDDDEDVQLVEMPVPSTPSQKGVTANKSKKDLIKSLGLNGITITLEDSPTSKNKYDSSDVIMLD